jgi:hypothetical protein
VVASAPRAAGAVVPADVGVVDAAVVAGADGAAAGLRRPSAPAPTAPSRATKVRPRATRVTGWDPAVDGEGYPQDDRGGAPRDPRDECVDVGARTGPRPRVRAAVRRWRPRRPRRRRRGDRGDRGEDSRLRTSGLRASRPRLPRRARLRSNRSNPPIAPAAASGASVHSDRAAEGAGSNSCRTVSASCASRRTTT